jgi:hypothetical protein
MKSEKNTKKRRMINSETVKKSKPKVKHLKKTKKGKLKVQHLKQTNARWNVEDSNPIS